MTNWQTTGIDALWRIESPKIVAVLARMLGGDVGTAEELAQDALLTALERWPGDGMPDNPGAWLMATAKRRAIDVLRQRSLHARKHVDISRELEEAQAANDLDIDALDDPVGDDLLRLVFVACHPVLSTEAQVALTLRLLGGLTTDEIARAFLVPEPTIAQRIVRAKRTLSERNVPYEVPRGEELAQRVASVLAVIYLVFNEGYSATSGDDWMRPALCDEAMRLGRVLAGLLPQEPEVHGLVALMELQASRLKARTRADGTPILLLDQNRAHWDRLLIGRGLAGLELIRRLGGTRGFYALQAAIAACHAGAVTAEQTDWPRIAALYAQLLEVSPSPVIALNYAVAVSMADGPAAALDLVDGLRGEKVLQAYALLPGVRGDLLDRLGRKAEAREEFERAAQLTRNARERETFERRAAACAA
jgi:RNA polymerase sigma factor (sigma-70 family)